MSVTVLELNGVDISLPDGTDIAINYKVRDIRNLGFDGSYAESFTLPDTNLSRRVLGNSQFVTSGTKTPYRLLPATLKLRGNAILTGYAKHTEVNDGFSIDVDGGNADLFALVKGKKLSEVDLSGLDHTWNIANAVAANTHNAARGYIYPLINFGQWTDRDLFNGNVHFTELRPAVYVHTVIERMIAPYTLSGSLLSDAKYRKLIIPCTNEALKYRASYIADKFATARLSYDVELEVSTLETENNLITDTVTSDSLSLLEPVGSVDDAYVFRCPVAGAYQVKANVNIFHSAADVEVYAYRERDGVREPFFQNAAPSGVVQRTVIDYKLDNCQAEDIIYILIRTRELFSGAYAKLLAGSTFEVTMLNDAVQGGPVHLDANLPDVSQEDFLTAVFHMFNVLEQASPVQGVLRLDSLEQLRYQKPVDWSRKIDWTSKPVTTFALGEYGQRNYLSYAENEVTDAEGKPLTDTMVFEVDNETLEPEAEIFTSEFTLTQTLPAFRGQTDLPYIPVYKQVKTNYRGLWQPDTEYLEDEYVFHLTDYWQARQDNENEGPDVVNFVNWKKVSQSDIFEQQEATPRLMLLETRPTPIYVGEHHHVSSTYPFSVQGTFTGLESATLQAEYHGITELMLQDSRILTLNARLNMADINGLDFLRPVMLNIPHKNLQGMFYLNGVNQFMPGRNESTEVELVRIYGMPLVAASEGTHTEFSEEFNSSEFN